MQEIINALIGRLGEMNLHNFNKDLNKSEKSYVNLPYNIYEKIFQSKPISFKKLSFDEQKKGDILLKFSNKKSYYLEIKERKTFFPDLLLERKHIPLHRPDVICKRGWIFSSKCSILSYHQPFNENAKLYNEKYPYIFYKYKQQLVSLWKIQKIKKWIKSDEFKMLCSKNIIKINHANSFRVEDTNNRWKTIFWYVPFDLLIKKKFYIDKI